MFISGTRGADTPDTVLLWWKNSRRVAISKAMDYNAFKEAATWTLLLGHSRGLWTLAVPLCN